MIFYDGYKKIDNVHFIKFRNEHNKLVEIPIDSVILNQFVKYFERLQPAIPKDIEFGNEE